MKTFNISRLLATVSCFACLSLATSAWAGCPNGGGFRIPAVYPSIHRIIQPRPTYRPTYPTYTAPTRTVRRPVVRHTTQPQPVQTKSVQPQPKKPAKPANPVLQLTLKAKTAFQKQNFGETKSLMDKVVELSPKSAAAFQFRGLASFAMGDYDSAAADIYETLLLGNLWTSETVANIYGNEDVYNRHYAALSASAAQDKDSMSKHFLMAYHELLNGNLDRGESELKTVLRIQPNEPVTSKLLKVVQNLQQNETNKIASTR